MAMPAARVRSAGDSLVEQTGMRSGLLRSRPSGRSGMVAVYGGAPATSPRSRLGIQALDATAWPARVWEGARGQDSAALIVVVAGALAAGRPPAGGPGLPPHGPASWQGALASDTSSAQRRSAWRPGHTSGTLSMRRPCPSASAARTSRSRRSDTRRWPRNSPGVQRSEASGPETCSMPTRTQRQGVTAESCPYSSPLTTGR